MTAVSTIAIALYGKAVYRANREKILANSSRLPSACLSLFASNRTAFVSYYTPSHIFFAERGKKEMFAGERGRRSSTVFFSTCYCVFVGTPESTNVTKKDNRLSVMADAFLNSLNVTLDVA